ncbi:aldo/keto reductase [Chitinophaga sancti]|uniref:aldo/keto reductase n=1 Tax=Chitinophaga sancti TaxID=1004 RepID=UPI002A760C34|nr:aldo/keto reductase [Chitinophaga sancti]WPQ60434.1 aldo/keto reductase [Chitinophaga sancti]
MLQLSEVIMGTSGLGNLYQELSQPTKTAIVKEFITHSAAPPAFDSAGKYGAGLALECLGQALHELAVSPDDVIISNKLGWLRVPLEHAEPTFEPGIWKNLQYDAIQRIGYEGIMECYEQGNQLLGNYNANFVSVHDPDEYLAKAIDKSHEENLYDDILLAYKALNDLKKSGQVRAVGVGAKDWRFIKRLSGDVQLDWVMFANSYTIYDHPVELALFMHDLQSRGIFVINSAVFNGGFLTGGDYYNYKPVDKEDEYGQALLTWRARFFAVCSKYELSPATACIRFGLSAPGVKSIALNTSRPEQVAKNLMMTKAEIPPAFWKEVILL